MRLIEAILDANQRSSTRDGQPSLNPSNFADSLPFVILTCMDPRLNRAVPRALNLPEDSYFWIRNAGNVVTGPLGGIVRSVALACAMKNAREVALIGHSNCQICHTTMIKLTDAFKLLGVDRGRLPDNLNEFFGMFASEQQNVIQGAGYVRQSPLIGAKVPVHGLLLDLESGKLNWLVNGYQNLPSGASPADQLTRMAGQATDLLKSFPKFEYGEMKFPEMKIGEAVAKVGEVVSDARLGETRIGQAVTRLGELAADKQIGDTRIDEIVSKVGDLVADVRQPAEGVRETVAKAQHVARDVHDIVGEFLDPQPKGKKPPPLPTRQAPPVIPPKPSLPERGRSRPPKYAKSYGQRKNP